MHGVQYGKIAISRRLIERIGTIFINIWQKQRKRKKRKKNNKRNKKGANALFFLL